MRAPSTACCAGSGEQQASSRRASCRATSRTSTASSSPSRRSSRTRATGPDGPAGGHEQRHAGRRGGQGGHVLWSVQRTCMAGRRTRKRTVGRATTQRPSATGRHRPSRPCARPGPRERSVGDHGAPGIRLGIIDGLSPRPQRPPPRRVPPTPSESFSSLPSDGPGREPSVGGGAIHAEKAHND